MSECNVCIGSWDGDAAEFYHEQMVTARKVHKCYECGGEIAIGERYEYVSGKWEDEWAKYRFCAVCSEIGKALTCDGARTFGVLWEDIREVVFPEMTTACFQKLTTAKAKRHLREQWRAWKFRHAAA